MKVGRMVTVKEKLITRGRIASTKEFKKEFEAMEKETRKLVSSMKDEHRKQIDRLSSKHRATLNTLEKNHKRELKTIQEESDRLSKTLNRKIEELDEYIKLRDEEITKLKQITEQAKLENYRRNLVGDRVLKEASMLVKAQNELENLEQQADSLMRKYNKKLKLAK